MAGAEIDIHHVTSGDGRVWQLVLNQGQVWRLTDDEARMLSADLLMALAGQKASSRRASERESALEDRTYPLPAACDVCDGHGTVNGAPCPNRCDDGLIHPDDPADVEAFADEMAAAAEQIAADMATRAAEFEAACATNYPLPVDAGHPDRPQLVDSEPF